MVAGAKNKMVIHFYWERQSQYECLYYQQALDDPPNSWDIARYRNRQPLILTLTTGNAKCSSQYRRMTSSIMVFKYIPRSFFTIYLDVQKIYLMIAGVMKKIVVSLLRCFWEKQRQYGCLSYQHLVDDSFSKWNIGR